MLKAIPIGPIKNMVINGDRLNIMYFVALLINI